MRVRVSVFVCVCVCGTCDRSIDVTCILRKDNHLKVFIHRFNYISLTLRQRERGRGVPELQEKEDFLLKKQ